MSLRIRFRNVYGEAPEDRADVQVIDARTDLVVGRRIDHSTRRGATFSSVEAGVLYKIRVLSGKHRPVAHFLRVGGSGKAQLDVVLPIHPDRVAGASFPDFSALDERLKIALGRNGVGIDEDKARSLYNGLGDFEKAGLLNVWTKMTHTPMTEGNPASHYVDFVYQVRGDRFFADVNRSFRDLVRTATSTGAFKPVDGGLHTPPEGYEQAGSYKSTDGYGNLQLTFFAATATQLGFKLDADIDDANGVEHVFQVLRNWLTDGETHPYDIHQILAQHQGLDTGYRLHA
jgi:hypothetical protein